MLRVHCVQLFCNLSDPAMEDQLARRKRRKPGCGRGWSIRSGSRAGVRLRHGSPSRAGEERAAACAAPRHSPPDDCPAARTCRDKGEACPEFAGPALRGLNRFPAPLRMPGRTIPAPFGDLSRKQLAKPAGRWVNRNRPMSTSLRFANWPSFIIFEYAASRTSFDSHRI